MKRAAVVAALLALTVGIVVALWTSGDETPRVAPATPVAKTEAPHVERRARVEQTPDTKPADATPSAPTDDAKWPIRVTTNVPGATVTIQARLFGGDPDPAPVTKATDAKGFVGFETGTTSPIAELDFVARADGFAPESTKAETPGDVRIDLHRTTSIRGRVTDAAGAPVADASVLPNVTMASTEPIVYSDGDGRFETGVKTAGATTLLVKHAAFLSREVAVDAPASDVVVALDRGLSVSGRVAFPDGRPVPGAAISVEDRLYASAAADRDGRYVLAGLSRGPVPLNLAVTGETKSVDAGATGVDFVVSVPVAHVRCVDEQGRPYHFLGVEIRVREGDAERLDMFASGGLEDLDTLVPGAPGARLLVSAHGAPGIVGGAAVDFGDEPRLVDVPVVLGAKRPSGALRILARDEIGKPLSTVFVHVADEAGTTVAGGDEPVALDAGGAAEFRDVAAGDVEVSVAPTAHWSLASPLVAARSKARIEVGRTVEVAVALNLGGRIRAALKDADGKPLAPQDLRLTTDPAGEFSSMFVHEYTDSGGFTTKLDETPSLLLHAVPPGRYVVRATTQDDETVDQEVEVRRGETTDVVLIAKGKR